MPQPTTPGKPEDPGKPADTPGKGPPEDKPEHPEHPHDAPPGQGEVKPPPRATPYDKP